MGRTNIVIDDDLIEEVMRLTGAKTKREAVDLALRRLAEQQTAYQRILSLKGKLHWEGNIREWRRDRR